MTQTEDHDYDEPNPIQICLEGLLQAKSNLYKKISLLQKKQSRRSQFSQDFGMKSARMPLVTSQPQEIQIDRQRNQLHIKNVELNTDES